MSCISKIKIGDKFGELTVVSETNKRIRKAKIWKCKCSCGVIVEKKTDYLQQGWTKSCGCLRSKRARDRLPLVWAANPKRNKTIDIYKFNTLVRNYKSNAKSRKLIFSISDEQIFELVTQPCHYCGYIPQSQKGLSSISYSDYFVGIDRVSPDRGYVDENVLPCCKICNVAKSNSTYKEFIIYLNRI